METGSINKVVILGGGTAGWMAAALLRRALPENIAITLVESDQIGTVGVGEATIPPIRQLNQVLGIDEAEFLRETKGTAKLGIMFDGWRVQGESYMHAFGPVGKNFPFCEFHHYWARAQAEGYVSDYWDYSLNYQAAIAGKFLPLNSVTKTNLPGVSYAYHFDAGLYANLLRRHAETKGVLRVEGKVGDVRKAAHNDFVASLKLEDGREIFGDLFVDCSGFSGLLIGKSLGVKYSSWNKWLPCDRAIAVPSGGVAPVPPYTRSIAHDAGWQWQIPLQHRTGNGLVYSSAYWDADQALSVLMKNLPGEPLSEPKNISFQTGCREKQWQGNVVSIGLSSGFLEPLESTSIHLIQTGVTRLINFFPHHKICDQEIAEFNRLSRLELEAVRDFIILHYKVNERTDSKFWRDCANMDIPESLRNKIELFRVSGKMPNEPGSLFSESAWLQVMIGQGVHPGDYHPSADNMTSKQLRAFLQGMKSLICSSVESMPSHERFFS
ncbi:tryptophan halogenase family protein [Microbulbifer agarilyticus]|uniref:tryptophan halogenase family protein n=1 Tax=Microbulbifer agarilyticus TaxID=260552 RepID=UPI001CD34CEA|nr:tryptophan halogenase family protein [Microbulbifer agarilyticus]MCA0893018.1 tryptophan 7-halogenase [Microbulbifer agarilyticus]